MANARHAPWERKLIEQHISQAGEDPLQGHPEVDLPDLAGQWLQRLAHARFTIREPISQTERPPTPRRRRREFWAFGPRRRTLLPRVPSGCGGGLRWGWNPRISHPHPSPSPIQGEGSRAAFA